MLPTKRKETDTLLMRSQAPKDPKRPLSPIAFWSSPVEGRDLESPMHCRLWSTMDSPQTAHQPLLQGMKFPAHLMTDELCFSQTALEHAHQRRTACCKEGPTHGSEHTDPPTDQSTQIHIRIRARRPTYGSEHADAPTDQNMQTLITSSPSLQHCLI